MILVHLNGRDGPGLLAPEEVDYPMDTSAELGIGRNMYEPDSP